MDLGKSGRIVDSAKYPGVTFGKGVVLYGKVIIKSGTRIGDYCILGIPTIDQISERVPFSETVINSNVDIGSFCIVHNGAKIGSRVIIEEYCTIGWNSRIDTRTRIMYSSQIYYKVKIGRKCVIGGFCCDHSTIGDNVVMFGKLIHKFRPTLLQQFKDPIEAYNHTPPERAPKIDKGAFVGFDAIVIGGVKVQSGAYIPAGVTITKDVKKGKKVIGKI